MCISSLDRNYNFFRFLKFLRKVIPLLWGTHSPKFDWICSLLLYLYLYQVWCRYRIVIFTHRFLCFKFFKFWRKVFLFLWGPHVQPSNWTLLFLDIAMYQNWRQSDRNYDFFYVSKVLEESISAPIRSTSLIFELWIDRMIFFTK